MAERYVRLGLQAGRLEEGLVDAYFGPPELADGPPLTRRLVDLPAGERVELATVRDEPWLAFCHYRGGLRSRIEVNVDLPLIRVTTPSG